MKLVAGVFVSLVVSLCEIDATRYLLVNVPDGFNLGGGGGGGGGGPPGGEVHPGEKQNAFNFHIKKSLHTMTFFLFPSKANNIYKCVFKREKTRNMSYLSKFLEGCNFFLNKNNHKFQIVGLNDNSLQDQILEV
jgi:hypothetical protein